MTNTALSPMSVALEAVIVDDSGATIRVSAESLRDLNNSVRYVGLQRTEGMASEGQARVRDQVWLTGSTAREMLGSGSMAEVVWTARQAWARNIELAELVRDEVESHFNSYAHCGNTWTATRKRVCNDACPSCGREIEPHASDALSEMRSTGVESIPHPARAITGVPDEIEVWALCSAQVHEDEPHMRPDLFSHRGYSHATRRGCRRSTAREALRTSPMPRLRA